MPTTGTSPITDFSRDILGRFVCNGLDEARRSADPTIVRTDHRPQIEARDFDLIVIGGGTFGMIVAEHMNFRDQARNHRILVLEGGPFALSEHVQNMPVVGLKVAADTSIARLKAEGKFGLDNPQREVWGLPWHSSHEFPGLAYCVGGRSLYWGGWAPELLPEETPTASWPASVLDDLRAVNLADGSPGYFRQASDQLGVTETNDFIFGELHRALRDQLYEGLENHCVSGAVAVGSLPDHPAVRFADVPPDSETLADLLGLPKDANRPSEPVARDMLKIEAPLAVQGRTGHAGFFPFNKFSTVPLAIKAAREAYSESKGDDARKRFMIVPKCHVSRLLAVADGNEWRVVEIETNQGPLKVPPGARVVIALGTIESTRLVLESFKGLPPAAYGRIGTNLMVHLRSNLDLRIPRENLATLPATAKALQASALFVKGRHAFDAIGQDVGHFHLHITASGLGAIGDNSEAELFKKIPDVDLYQLHRNANDTHVVITIRGIGEMQPGNPGSRVTLDPGLNETDEFGVQRALVTIADPRDKSVRDANPRAARDFALWQAMDQAARDLAKVFGVAQPNDPERDGLGTTHHETGTLWLGEEQSDSVTLPDCRLRHVRNAYVAGPALFPTIGSANPMLAGVALARRLGDHLATPMPYTVDDGFEVLFDGTSTKHWRMTTIRNQPGRDRPGWMRIIDGTLETVAGDDMGIFWCTRPTPRNFMLRLEWLRWTEDSNSGVYLRFPDPERKGYDNTAYVADDFGFEVQIDELGAPDGAAIHKTGAIYRKDNRTDGEVLNLKPARGVAQWNEYEIRVEEQIYTVRLNGDEVCRFDNTNRYPGRGLPSSATEPSFIGLQVYANPSYYVRFRKIRIRELP